MGCCRCQCDKNLRASELPSNDALLECNTKLAYKFQYQMPKMFLFTIPFTYPVVYFANNADEMKFILMLMS